MNPARIIPAWRDLADRAFAAGGPFLGVGEPVWAGRSAAELDECHRHEALINVAFGDDPAWELICPYHAAAPKVIADARMTHPTVHDGRACCHASVDGVAAFNALERPLSLVPPDAVTMRFERHPTWRPSACSRADARPLRACRSLAPTTSCSRSPS